MNNLSIHGPPLGGGASNHAPPMPSGGPPQLPPQMFTTAAQLLDLTDKKLVLVLRDGRKIIGVLRSWDQFANLVLTESVERIFAKDVYADVRRGVFLVRGENVLLLGEIDLDKDDYVPEPYRLVPDVKAYELQKAEKAERNTKDAIATKKLHNLGFEVEGVGEVLY